MPIPEWFVPLPCLQVITTLTCCQQPRETHVRICVDPLIFQGSLISDAPQIHTPYSSLLDTYTEQQQQGDKENILKGMR